MYLVSDIQWLRICLQLPHTPGVAAWTSSNHKPGTPFTVEKDHCYQTIRPRHAAPVNGGGAKAKPTPSALFPWVTLSTCLQLRPTGIRNARSNSQDSSSRCPPVPLCHCWFRPPLDKRRIESMNHPTVLRAGKILHRKCRYFGTGKSWESRWAAMYDTAFKIPNNPETRGLLSWCSGW